MIRMADNQQSQDPLLSPAVLGFLVIFGIFNRVTFPAFTAIPCLLLVPHMLRRSVLFTNLQEIMR